MADICPNCGSADTQHGLSQITCLNCGRLSNYDSSAATDGPDAHTKAILANEARFDDRANVVGNLADLQVAHATEAADTNQPTREAFYADDNATVEDNSVAKALEAQASEEAAADLPSAPESGKKK